MLIMLIISITKALSHKKHFAQKESKKKGRLIVKINASLSNQNRIKKHYREKSMRTEHSLS